MGAAGAFAYGAGHLHQHHQGYTPRFELPSGTETPEPVVEAEADTPRSEYQDEQQSNCYFPPGAYFPSSPVWSAGRALMPHAPDRVARPLVETFSDPSNPEAGLNRQRVAALAAASAAAGSIVCPPLAPLLLPIMAAGTFTLGAEHEAESQATQTPRLPPNPAVHQDPAQIAEDYKELDRQYSESGYAAQSAVARHMPPTKTNAQVSHSIHGKLLPDNDSPFVLEKKETD